MAIRNAILDAIATGATPWEIEVAIEAAAVAGTPAVQMTLPLQGEIAAPANDNCGDIEVAATAAAPLVIPVGQGELF